MTPNGQQIPSLPRQGTSKLSQRTAVEDPWQPLVLSLDGGGVRGLSSLFILRRIMNEVRILLANEPDNNPITKALGTVEAVVAESSRSSEQSSGSSHTAGSTDKVDVLPCYFFDYMIGTSTGGLIAIMLGRLRMNIDDCIMEYWKLSNYIFRPPPCFFHIYDAGKLKAAIESVVRDHCGCQGSGCKCQGDEEDFRQYDYAEEGEANAEVYRNQTCKVAVVSQRQGACETEPYLWRTYSHSRRFPGVHALEYNPRRLDTAKVKLWEVCRATTAAPLYFPIMIIDGKKHMDGGVGDNNPSSIAWNEAGYMTIPPPDGRSEAVEQTPALLLSIGTGERNRENRFGTKHLLTWARRQITDTHKAHLWTQEATRNARADYYRFTVPRNGYGHAGLSDVRLDECRKRSRQPWWRRRKEEPEDGSWHAMLQKEARETTKGGFKPQKYIYETFDILFDRTEEYCDSGQYKRPPDSQNLHNEACLMPEIIRECAEKLVYYARIRQAQDPERYRRFVSHPNPNHCKHLPVPKLQ